MKCYQYDSNGYFKFVTDDYGQGLPRNATYVEPLEEKEGYLLKCNKESETWEYEEISKEIEEMHVPTQQELLNQLNGWLSTRNLQIAQELSLDVVAGLTLTEAKKMASKSTAEIIEEYAEKLAIIQAGGNPFELEVQK